MRRIAQALCGAVALLLTVTGVAHADVAHVNTASVTATSSSISIGEFPVAGAGRVLAVGVSTVDRQRHRRHLRRPAADETDRPRRPRHARRDLDADRARTGSGTVQVTLSGNATATVGATLFNGVDQASPVIGANAGDADTGATSAVAVLNNMIAVDGMLGVLALGNVAQHVQRARGRLDDL